MVSMETINPFFDSAAAFPQTHGADQGHQWIMISLTHATERNHISAVSDPPFAAETCDVCLGQKVYEEDYEKGTFPPAASHTVPTS